MNLHHRVPVADGSAIGAARRLATRLAQDAGADETRAGQAAIVASELATNLALHARGGELLMQVLDVGDGAQIEFLAIDRGPGMADVQRCLGDGYSTAGTPGNGLGAVRRFSAVFDVYSIVGQGTLIVARLPLAPTLSRAPQRRPALEIAGISIAVQGETVCGDAWHWQANEDGFTLLVADGLGHGLQAHEASSAAVTAFASAADALPATVLQKAHERMSSTRGGAVACARVSRGGGSLNYAGVGNICGSLLSGTRSQGLISHNGTVGAQMRRVQAFDYPWSDENLLIMHSDGISARWNLKDYPGLVTRHPALVAAMLYRDAGRPRDDATVVAIRYAAA